MSRVVKTVLIFLLGIVVIALALFIDRAVHSNGFIGIIGLILGWAVVCFFGLYRMN
ncbi:MAG: hypothetical protein HZC28_02730 [Spirochaetes bacterium]|nr:hypothetical protein [Spirochaetota bacterium]